MRRALLAALLLAAAPAMGLELTAYVDAPPANCSRHWLKVDPAYAGTNPCAVATIPAAARNLAWTATELWEKPPAGSPPGWTHLTCGAAKDGAAWSFSCFNSGVIGVEGLHSGTAAQLDSTVRGWWNGQR